MHMINQIDGRIKSDNSDLKLNPTMAATSVFDSIVRQIQLSNLNIKLQLSPFAAEISLKKTPSKIDGAFLSLCLLTPYPSLFLETLTVKTVQLSLLKLLTWKMS